MKERSRIIAIGVTALAVAAGATGVAIAGGGNEDATENEAPISGGALDRAEAAALQHTGQGTVTDTEVGDEESLYEVEVTLDDGSETDVQLDRAFNVVSSELETGSEANDTE